MAALPIPEDVLLNARDFMQLLKDQGMVIGPRTIFEKRLVKGVPFEEYKRRVLQKKLISFSEISLAKLWGDISQKRAYQIAKEHLADNDLIRIDGKIKIPQTAVKSIAYFRKIEL